MKKLAVLFLAVGLVLVVMPSAHAADVDAAPIFKSKCAVCHGADGKGQTTMGKNLHLRDLGSEDVQKMKGEELEKIITDGKNKMPAYKGKLKEEEIDALVKLIRTFAPKK
ncbi:MAG TPA: c-type cytochrome [Acetobacteraceae bacterium]|nr:c-type cytochrome [Acetobacteraceae bacterium]